MRAQARNGACPFQFSGLFPAHSAEEDPGRAGREVPGQRPDAFIAERMLSALSLQPQPHQHCPLPERFLLFILFSRSSWLLPLLA